MIYIENKRKSKKTLLEKYPGAKVIDITSKADEPFVRLSPFYPHGKITVPTYTDLYAMSVEGIWQGLKVFENEDIDVSKFQITDMKGIKRTVRKFGKPLGHRSGTGNLLDYMTARKKIYLKAYADVLDNRVQDIILLLKAEAEKQDIILLDYNTNEDIDNPQKPLSHAALVKRYLVKKYPELANLRFEHPNLIEMNKKVISKPVAKTKRNTKKGGRSKNNKNQLSLF